MADFLTEISKSADSWGTTTTDVDSDTLVELFIKVTPGEAKLIEVKVPVEGDGFTTADALASRASWDSSETRLTLVKGSGVKKIERMKSSRAFAIGIEPDKSPDELILKLAIKTTNTKQASAELIVKYKFKQDELGAGNLTVNVTRVAIPPKIRSFTTSNGVLSPNESFTLKWDVEDAATLIVKNMDTKAETSVLETTSIEFTLSNLSAKYKLIATNGVGKNLKKDEKDVVIYCTETPGVGSLKPFGNGAQLVNLFVRADKLYALVLNSDKNDVLLWLSEDGANWVSTTASFINGNIDNVPLEFAGSASVIYNDCIYLIGGSRFDVNFRSNDMYYYDFKKAEGWRRETTNLDTRFSERMGHALVVVKNQGDDTGQIWLLGGHGENGCQNDIHIYSLSDKKWSTDAGVKMPAPLCMHNVISTKDDLQIFGGFSDTPGYPDRLLKDSDVYKISTKKWSKIWDEAPVGAKEHTWYIMSAAVAFYNNYRIIFGLFLNGTTTTHATLRIKGDLSFENVSRSDYMLPDYFTSVQAVYFNRAVWLSVLEETGKLKSNDLWYFFQTPPKD